MKFDLDDRDLAIIQMLQESPEISQIEISKKLGLSQPSVSARLRRLKESGIISLQAGINLKKVDLYVAKVDLSIRGKSNRLIEIFSKCPYCINGFIMSGKRNIVLFFVNEDIKSLEAIVENRIRPLPQITDVEFNIVLMPIKNFIVPIKLEFNKTSSLEKNLCEPSCKGCEMYKTNRCYGCPITPEYKGNLWKRVINVKNHKPAKTKIDEA